MRGLSTLILSRERQKSKGLTRLDDRMMNRSECYSWTNPSQSQSQPKQYFPCAYHVGEKISNFCVNSNCLLPLCPKCIKIHSEEHQKIGVHGNFATIQECIFECRNTQNQSVARLQEILQVCEEMQSLHKQQLFLCRQQLQKAKLQMIDYIQSVFAFYEDETGKLILETSRQYEQQLLVYRRQITTLMVTEKQLAKKAQYPNLRLEFLIDYYSRSNLSVLLNNYAAKIQAIQPEYLQLAVNTYELERIKVIIKKYLDFGQFNSQIEEKLSHNLSYQRVTIVSQTPQSPTHKRQQSLLELQNTEPLKQFVRSPIKNLFTIPDQLPQKADSQPYSLTQTGEIVKILSQSLKRQSMLDRFQSPLENYSLEKSRRSRS